MREQKRIERERREWVQAVKEAMPKEKNNTKSTKCTSSSQLVPNGLTTHN